MSDITITFDPDAIGPGGWHAVARLRAERDRKAAALARVLAECDATWAAADGYDEDDEAQRELITRIRAAAEEPTQ